MSDKFDGADERYPIVATIKNAPDDAAIEASIIPNNGGERPIGLMCPVREGSDTLELLWDIPPTLAEGTGTLRVRMFSNLSSNAAILATDDIAIDLQHHSGPSPNPPAVDALALTWPGKDAPLGFNKAVGIDKPWVTVLDGVISDAATTNTPPKTITTVKLYYSKTPIGEEPKFIPCGSNVTAEGKERSFFLRFTGACTLAAGDVPSSVTAVAAALGDKVSDARRVQPYIQSPGLMSVSIAPQQPNNQINASYPSGRRRAAATACLTFTAFVRDQLTRPVVGANVDAILSGPSDLVAFGNDANTKAPDTGGLQEDASNCSGGAAGQQKQVREIVPNGPDRKIAESVTGTDAAGGWTFKLYSPDPGRTEVTVWVDDAEIVAEHTDRPPDNDVQDSWDATTTSWGQWLDGALRLSVVPHNDAAATSTCHLYTVTARAGSEVLAGLNIDFHARMPDRGLTMCHADDAVVLEPADSGHPEGHIHKPQGTGAVPCNESGPPCVHMEGRTNDDGKLIFGISSGTAGIASLQIWSDGEPEKNDDAITTGEPQITTTTNFTGYAQQVTVKLLNPSSSNQAGGGKISTSTVPVVARVDASFHVRSLSVYLAPSNSSKYEKIGEAEKVAMTDTYVFEWDLSVPLEDPTATPSPTPSPSETRGRPSATPTPSESPTPTPLVSGQPTASPPPRPTPPPPPSSSSTGIKDGSYNLKVVVDGTGQSDSITVAVNRTFNPQGDDTTMPYAYAITGLSNGAPLAFPEGTARISGLVSREADGVDIFYTINSTRDSVTWTRCAWLELQPSNNATASAPKPFSDVPCVLDPSHSGSQVTAISVVAYDCQVPISGCTNPTPAPGEVGRGSAGGSAQPTGGGQVVRVFGCDRSPCMNLAPHDWQANKGTCQTFVVMAGDEQGTPYPNLNVDVTLRGPGDAARFCNRVEGVSPMRAPRHDGDTFNRIQSVSRDPNGPDRYHTEGETDAEGRFTFGVVSDESGFDSIFSTTENSYMAISAWLDLDGDDQFSAGEMRRSAAMHWLLPNRCTIVGTEGDDVLVGTVDDDKICGLGGNDVIFAQEGNDIVLGGPGDDEIWGDEGDDVLRGQGGDDTLFGGPGRDTLDGGRGENTCPDYQKKRDKKIVSCTVPPRRPQ